MTDETNMKGSLLGLPDGNADSSGNKDDNLAPSPDNPASLCNKSDHISGQVHAQIASMNQHAAPQDAVDGGDLVERPLKQKFLEFMGSSRDDFRSKVIQAVCDGTGWEESSIELVDNHILPAIPSLPLDVAAEELFVRFEKEIMNEGSSFDVGIKTALRALTANGDVLIRGE